MSLIEIRRAHDLGLAKARKAAETVAEELDGEFQLDYEWDGDTLCFCRNGIEGELEVTAGEVVVLARLGLFLRPLRGRFEREIHRYLDEVFEQA